jgi:hypothetical protein
MPDLTIGAARATATVLFKAFEGHKKHDFQIRPDLGLLIGDVYEVSYTDAGTNRTEAHDIIVESVSLSVGISGKVSSDMTVSGREEWIPP